MTTTSASLLPGLGPAREDLLRMHEALRAKHSSVFAYDRPDGVLHLFDEAVPAPPLGDFWSRIFIDESLPLTEVVRTGMPTDGGFDSVDSSITEYAGFNGNAVGFGRVMCFPLTTADERLVGVLFCDGCAGVDEIGHVGMLWRRHATGLRAMAEQVAADLDTIGEQIASRIFGLGQLETEPTLFIGPEHVPTPPEIRAAIGTGTFWWRLREGVIHLDAVAMGAADPAEKRGYTGGPAPLLYRIHRDDYPLVRRTMARALAEEGVFALEYRAHTRGGSLRWLEVRGRVIRDERGEPVMLGIVTDTTGAPSWTQVASTQIDAMADGFAILDPYWRLVYGNEAVARLAGVGRAELAGRAFADVLSPLRESEWKPAFDQALATGETVSFEALLPRVGRWYELRVAVDAGRLAVHLRDVHEYRVQLERERERETRRERTGEFAAALGGTLGVDDVIAVVEQHLPELCGAEGIAMHVVTDGRLRLIAAVGYTPAGFSALRVLDLDVPGPMSDAVNKTEPQIYETSEQIKDQYPYLTEVVDDTKTGALLVHPLMHEGSCLGLVCLRFDEPRRLSSSYRGFVARRCEQLAQALYRAHRYDAELSLASRLRDAVFDVPLDQTPGVELASEYRSPGLGLAVGGDWYDVIPMLRGRIGLLVGDVEGHNARAVGGMSMVRTAIRAFAHEGYGPAAILGRVNKLITGLDPDLLATCCFAELDTAAGTARIARAGHPSPVLSLPDGGTAVLPLPAGLPLGVDPSETYRSVLSPLPEGALLALYSDGLVESRSLPIDQGTDRLVESLRGHGNTPLRELARKIIGHPYDQPTLADDITLLLARRTA
ncbi:SpoIIE family protein phosphatase [Actinospica robiniae]|uniref:SpoIIE family protein phosphatase n=1 Tax=Actinospica robiniae TaxID=304901 RepID=UPI0003FBB765|nr:SpoIIE family protein phosphatase [Actinospica robiniae]